MKKVNNMLLVLVVSGSIFSYAENKPVKLLPLVKSDQWSVTASSKEADFASDLAVDGSMSTRWGSEFKNGQWWMVNFGRQETLGKITVNWEDAFASAYGVSISEDGTNWVEVFSDKKGHGGVQVIRFESRPVMAVKVDCIERGTEWGFSLKEVEFNAPEPIKVEATSSTGDGDYAASFAVDGNTATRWSSGFNDNDWWQGKFEEPVELSGLKISWETAFAEKYEIAVSDDGKNWKTVYTVTDGDGKTDLIFFKPVITSFIRINCSMRGTGWGNSIWEIAFFEGRNRPTVIASSEKADAPAMLALDGDTNTFWHSDAATDESITISLPSKTSLGGIELTWSADYPTEYRLEASLNGQSWLPIFEEKSGNGGKDFVFFSSREAGLIKIICAKTEGDRGAALANVEFKSGEEQATPIRYYQSKAKDSKLGILPMWLSRQQEFWTVVGVIGDTEESLLGETGSFEPFKGGVCVTPMLIEGTNLVTYADVQLSQKLEEEYLPLPSVSWSSTTWRLDISAVAFGAQTSSLTAVRYRFRNMADTAFAGRLALAVRPVQLNPIWQNGGMSPVNRADVIPAGKSVALKINGRPVIISATPTTNAGVAKLVDGEIADFLQAGTLPSSWSADDKEGKVGAVLMYDMDVPAGGTRDVVVLYPLHTASKADAYVMRNPSAGFARVWEQQRKYWRQILSDVEFNIPEDRLIKVMKSNWAYVLVNRDGPWFKPGTRNYNHSWMRDGALTGVAAMRMGKSVITRQFIESFSRFVTEDGWVPFMVMEHGAPCGYNPNLEGGEGQEYDSQGEFPFVVRQYYDFSKDRELIEKVYPAVVRALKFGQKLRQLRMTDEYKNDPEKKAYYGILPASNSHEGYFPAKHSYWDDFWMIRGFKDGVYLAELLGKPEDAAWMKAEEEDLRKCLNDSIKLVMEKHGLKNIPGCVELGDTDPTSTTVAIMACDELENLLQPEGSNTFNIFFQNFSRRLVPGGDETFTPYEARNADVFVRIGQRERALTMLRYFTSQSTRPYAWNHLAEVVHARLRAPSYLGDMPHTWVGSDYINAVRSMFAFEQGDRLYLAGGMDPLWLKSGVGAKNLPTQFGAVSFRWQEKKGEWIFEASGKAVPPGGFILPLPESMNGVAVEVNGKAISETDQGIPFKSLPVKIRMFVPKSEPDPATT